MKTQTECLSRSSLISFYKGMISYIYIKKKALRYKWEGLTNGEISPLERSLSAVLQEEKPMRLLAR